MNATKMIISMIRRSYRSQKGWNRKSNPGIQRRLDVLEDGAEENDVESIEDSDLENEPDFSQAHQSYSSYKNELTKNKELLKLRIVARKYFKEVEPNLLTYVEKEQIRYLHDSDPLEYTPEKLSESFPALSQTIRKVLKAKWVPTSADRVLKHDQLVIENWKKFKRGELPLEPQLREHLQKFKGRKINLPDREELEKKFIPPEKSFVKPKSQLYSGIIQSYLVSQRKDEDPINKEENSYNLEENDAGFTGSNNKRNNYDDLMDRPKRSAKNDRVFEARSVDAVAVSRSEELSGNKKIRGKNPVTLDEFFKDRMKSIEDTSSIEDKVLVDAYKKKMETRKVSADSEDRLRDRNLNTRFEQSDSVTLLNKKDVQISVDEHTNQQSVKVIDNDPKELGLETFVKAWEKKESQDEDYPESIVIPRKIYSKGKLYKLGDCYYDNDGEFLYRVPGFKE